MGFPSEIPETREEQQARQERRSRWICETGWHKVTIVDWSYTPQGTRKYVCFTVQDARGRVLQVSFRLTVTALKDQQLLWFIAAARNFDPNQACGGGVGVHSRDQFDSVLGETLMVKVARRSDGLHQVSGYAPDPDKSSAND